MQDRRLPLIETVALVSWWRDCTSLFSSLKNKHFPQSRPVAVLDFPTCFIATVAPLAICFAWRLQWAATERDDLRVGTTVIVQYGSALVVEERPFVYATLFLAGWAPRGLLFHHVWQDRQLDPGVSLWHVL